MESKTEPPATINIGRNSFTAKAINYDFLSEPDSAIKSFSRSFDEHVAQHYEEALAGERHLSEMILSYRSSTGLVTTGKRPA